MTRKKLKGGRKINRQSATRKINIEQLNNSFKIQDNNNLNKYLIGQNNIQISKVNNVQPLKATMRNNIKHTRRKIGNNNGRRITNAGINIKTMKQKATITKWDPRVKQVMPMQFTYGVNNNFKLTRNSELWNKN
jgi:hypothetical protein